MQNEKTDLRIIKTKTAIFTAMAKLLEKQSFTKITVNDICREALISRSTFYFHFEDKYQLLMYCMEQINNEIYNNYKGDDIKSMLYTVLDGIKKNSRIINNMILADLDMELLDIMRRSSLADYTVFLQKKIDNGSILPGPVDLLSTFLSSGVSSTVLLWVMDGLKYSTEEIGEYLYKLFSWIDSI